MMAAYKYVYGAYTNIYDCFDIQDVNFPGQSVAL